MAPRFGPCQTARAAGRGPVSVCGTRNVSKPFIHISTRVHSYWPRELEWVDNVDIRAKAKCRYYPRGEAGAHELWRRSIVRWSVRHLMTTLGGNWLRDCLQNVYFFRMTLGGLCLRHSIIPWGEYINQAHSNSIGVTYVYTPLIQP